MQGKDNLQTGIELINAIYNQGVAPGFARAREQAATTIAEQMQSRNIRGSGIHGQVLTDAMARLQSEEAEAANRLALDVYNVLDETTQRQFDREHQYNMYKLQQAHEQSQANQNKRGAIVSGVLGLASAAAGAGGLGGGGGAAAAPSGGGIATAITNPVDFAQGWGTMGGGKYSYIK
jgi:hypothetical protein